MYSLLQLVNLSRLGNENIAKRYNLRALYSAAIEVTKVTTGDLPHSRTEVYGAQAMDVVFAEGGKFISQVILIFHDITAQKLCISAGMGAGSKVNLCELVGDTSLRK